MDRHQPSESLHSAAQISVCILLPHFDQNIPFDFFQREQRAPANMFWCWSCRAQYHSWISSFTLYFVIRESNVRVFFFNIPICNCSFWKRHRNSILTTKQLLPKSGCLKWSSLSPRPFSTTVLSFNVRQHQPVNCYTILEVFLWDVMEAIKSIKVTLEFKVTGSVMSS